MDGTLRHCLISTLVLLLLCAVASPADAQQFVCWPMAPGDTASSLARQLIGNAAAAYTHAFQIRDPARRMFVPKSQYLRLGSAWQVCVATGPVTTTPLAHAPVVELPASPAVPVGLAIAPVSWASVPAPLAPGRPGWTLPEIPFGAKAGGTILAILLLGAAAGFLTPRPIPPHIRRAGEVFATAFARPLFDPSSNVPPIRTRLRFVRRKQQLEIFIAPGPGRRYPNLADHKHNVEYDVSRVIRVLGDHYVLTNRPRAVGKWVVVTVGRADSKQTGVT